ncbi:FMN-dependent NADH-azoreductase (plasmid) [Labrenzia sp. THAF191b]|jgi:FMN-dependent NADH-azoreductase|uniref:FMN-dependent NADH-azoreductase n=1 Tax=unclassified Labrenzia TaxID=2648686 RepID=UPI0012695EEB|nr:MULTISPECIES: NAD(P)H-dependent oxidoreductase [unclassified Labrenzia]QFT01799.1 FMN-dependent NADH-azoreductase [Labrenzia sp. THAF191b]QFT08004.1 FMN-dependent NADH-azoreductase [Labrenzia sp. THAF191a]QFT19631.1 FMN-dependent NADH-azoreductase [Labrenzia sp. THAF187b]
MSKVLVLTSSVLGDASVSNQLTTHIVNQLRLKNGKSKVIARDLGSNPVPHLTQDSTIALRVPEAENEVQANAQALSDELIAELKAADLLVIGAPMYNFGIPSTLKAWFDYVLRAGVTFSYSEAGPEGLLKGKRAIVVLTRGGLYSEGPAQLMDAQEPHLRTLLGFIGITDVTFIRAEKLAFGAAFQEEAIAAAKKAANEVVDELQLVAA